MGIGEWCEQGLKKVAHIFSYCLEKNTCESDFAFKKMKLSFVSVKI